MRAVADRNGVIGAFRLGWAIAEFRGRTRTGHGEDLSAPPVADAARTSDALPLSVERLPGEQATESREVLATLAGDLGVDVLVGTLSGQTSGRDMLASARLRQLADLHQGERSEPEDPEHVEEGPERIWRRLQDFLYAWDARIQDLLASGPFARASAYQLGRGLAESTWALKVEAPANVWGSWAFVLGEERRAYLQQLLDRLTPYLQPLTLPAVKQTLDRWHQQAGMEASKTVAERRISAAPQKLRQQAQRWRDLIVTGQDPRFPLEPGQKVSKRALVWPIARELWLPLSLAGFGVAALIAGAYLVPLSGSAGALAGILGVAGITTGTLSAKAKSSAQELLKQARSVYDIAVAVQATLILP